MHAPSKTNIILTVIILALVVWLVVMQAKKAPETTVTPAPTETTTPTAWPSAEVKKETISESTSAYSIDVAYPSTNDDRITAQMKAFVTDQIAQFKEDTSWANNPDIAPAEAASLSLEITYKEERSAHVDNYIFNIVTYTGGAHDLQVTHTQSYDQNGKALNLSDLFTNQTMGLKVVSDYVMKEITKRGVSDAAWIKEGAGPSAENYQSFIVSDAGITFVFDPYQVAPYAAGTQTVLVPFAALKGVLNTTITQ